MPSPRQKVEELADVPLFRFVTGRFPVTPVESETFVIVFELPLIDLFESVSALDSVERELPADGTDRAAPPVEFLMTSICLVVAVEATAVDAVSNRHIKKLFIFYSLSSV